MVVHSRHYLVRQPHDLAARLVGRSPFIPLAQGETPHVSDISQRVSASQGPAFPLPRRGTLVANVSAIQVLTVATGILSPRFGRGLRLAPSPHNKPMKLSAPFVYKEVIEL